jgi:hypothetical protein
MRWTTDADPLAVRTMTSAGEQIAFSDPYVSDAQLAGVPCSHHEWAGGHDPFWWRRTLPEALAWLLA